jgi:hypothetical protein
MFHQKDAAIAVQHRAANAQGHAAGEPPVDMKQAAQRRFEPPPYGLQIHDG